MESIQPRPQRSIYYYRLFQVVNNIVDIENPAGLFGGGYCVSLTLRWSANGCVCDDTGLRSVKADLIARIDLPP